MWFWYIAQFKFISNFVNLLIPYSASLQNLLRVFTELHFGPEDSVPFSVLSQHPFIQSLMENSTEHQLVVGVLADSLLPLLI